MTTALAIGAALLLAFANGANDNAKGVATLIGSSTRSLRASIYYAAGATFLGSVAAVFLAGGLVEKFSGKGLVDASVLATPAFLTSVAVAGALTVLLATRLGMPISTTHSLVGGICGAGFAADALFAGKIVTAFVVPLLVAPLLALVIAAPLYALFRAVRCRMGITSKTCVCIEKEYYPVTIASDGAVVMEATGLRVSDEHDAVQCRQRYAGAVAGVDAQRVLDGSHILSAGAVSFARGLNDTPKIAAVMIALGAASTGLGLSLVGVAIAAGGLLAVRRVAQTMSYRITEMNDGQAFTANLVTAFCVLVASRFGVPVSTTHVSCGSLFGIGIVNRKAHVGMIGTIVAAWITTLPVAAVLAYVTFGLLR